MHMASLTSGVNHYSTLLYPKWRDSYSKFDLMFPLLWKTNRNCWKKVVFKVMYLRICPVILTCIFCSWRREPGWRRQGERQKSNSSHKSQVPCKRTQHCWPTTPNIFGCYTSRPFAHPVACCWELLRKVWNQSNLWTSNSQHFFRSVIAEA